ncbi:hypothetical protein [Dactylosporangium sp. NPDC000521]
MLNLTELGPPLARQAEVTALPPPPLARRVPAGILTRTPMRRCAAHCLR